MRDGRLFIENVTLLGNENFLDTTRISWAQLDITKEDIVSLGIPSEDTVLEETDVIDIIFTLPFRRSTDLPIATRSDKGMVIFSDDFNFESDGSVSIKTGVIQFRNDDVLEDANIDFEKLNITKEDIVLRLGIPSFDSTLSSNDVKNIADNLGYIKRLPNAGQGSLGVVKLGDGLRIQDGVLDLNIPDGTVNSTSFADGTIISFRKLNITSMDIVSLGVPEQDTTISPSTLLEYVNRLNFINFNTVTEATDINVGTVLLGDGFIVKENTADGTNLLDLDIAEKIAALSQDDILRLIAGLDTFLMPLASEYAPGVLRLSELLSFQMDAASDIVLSLSPSYDSAIETINIEQFLTQYNEVLSTMRSTSSFLGNTNRYSHTLRIDAMLAEGNIVSAGAIQDNPYIYLDSRSGVLSFRNPYDGRITIEDIKDVTIAYFDLEKKDIIALGYPSVVQDVAAQDVLEYVRYNTSANLQNIGIDIVRASSFKENIKTYFQTTIGASDSIALLQAQQGTAQYDMLGASLVYDKRQNTLSVHPDIIFPTMIFDQAFDDVYAAFQDSRALPQYERRSTLFYYNDAYRVALEKVEATTLQVYELEGTATQYAIPKEEAIALTFSVHGASSETSILKSSKAIDPSDHMAVHVPSGRLYFYDNNVSQIQDMIQFDNEKEIPEETWHFFELNAQENVYNIFPNTYPENMVLVCDIDFVYVVQQSGGTLAFGSMNTTQFRCVVQGGRLRILDDGQQRSEGVWQHVVISLSSSGKIVFSENIDSSQAYDGFGMITVRSLGIQQREKVL